VALALSEAYDVQQAATGAEALGIVRREPVAAVVLDYRLPDQTGLDVLSQIKSAQPRLPVIMMTGYGSEGVCASALKLGIRDYFPKPLSVFDLRQSLGRILAEDRPGSREALGNREQDRWAQARLRGQPDLRIQKAAVLIHCSRSASLAGRLGIGVFSIRTSLSVSGSPVSVASFRIAWSSHSALCSGFAAVPRSAALTTKLLRGSIACAI
jgi:DNA-binding response OmpR family regulator